jgi:hypothetical protein
MFSLFSEPVRMCQGVSRREWLRVGGLGLGGITLPQLLAGRSLAGPAFGQSTIERPAMFGRAKNVLVVWLQGGPPQHETWDPKPDAPAEIRGAFGPIQTNIPGIQIGELLPRLATRADKLAIVRSLCTHNDLHDASAYWVLTGYPYRGRQSREISPTDWPWLGSVIKQLKPSEELPAYSAVWLPDWMRLNDNVTPAGQTAGFLGHRWEPERLVCDPSTRGFQVQGLTAPGEVPPLRLSARQSLLSQVETHFELLDRGGRARDFDRQTQQAFDVLASGRARQAFDLEREPESIRRAYGSTQWGQSLLLGRRLIEAGARLVHVNWCREPGDEAVNNPMWDTHAQNADRLQDVLCPLFDVTFSTLLDDLDERGLLAETLVLAIGEFGRTPRINGQGGRDHWGHVFSFALAGAGIAGGQVFGSSDRQGGYPREGRIEPQELTATILHLLGIGHEAAFVDAVQRPHAATLGTPIAALLGSAPATPERVAATGNLALVPAFTQEALFNTGFEDDLPFLPLGPAGRERGWRAFPRSGEGPEGVDLRVARLQGPALVRTGVGAAGLGFGFEAAGTGGPIPQGTRLLLTQELRNPRQGLYEVVLQVAAGGVAADFRELLALHFSAHVVLFGYKELTKDLRQGMREFARVPVDLEFDDELGVYREVRLSARLRSQDDSANEIEMGVGLVIVLEKTSPGVLELPAGSRAWLALDDVGIRFTPRPRNDNVRV